MSVNTSSLRITPVSLSMALGCATVGSAFAAPASDAFPTHESYIKVSGYAPMISGSDSSFEKRVGRDSKGGLGIEDLRILKDFDDVTTLVRGRALYGSEDYLLSFESTKAEVGKVEAGYKRFRTFYDGVGGFFPLNNRWFALSDSTLHVDRGTFWAAATLELPDRPVVELKYTNATRTGQKDSTIWADTNLTGLPTVPTNNATRKIAPSYWDLDERQQTVEASVRHTLGNTTAVVRAAYETVDNLNELNTTRFPGEITPSPERIYVTLDGLSSTIYSVLGTTETTFGDKLKLSTGFSYQDIGSKVTGDRANAVGVATTYDYKDLYGHSKGTVYTANAALAYTPTQNWYIQPALRWEDSYIQSKGAYHRVTVTSGREVYTLYRTFSRVKDEVLTPELSVRYSGIRRLGLYATASNRITDGDDRHHDQYTAVLPTAAQQQFNFVNQDQAHYKVGANWNASGKFTLRSEVFYKDHENKFVGYASQVGGLYVVGYEFTGVKLTAIAKPLPEWSFTTRYQPQVGTMEVTTDATAKFDSMKARTHLIGETIDWNPTPNLYFQASGNIAFNVIKTAYPYNQDSVRKQRNADNNYYSGSLISGFVVDKVTDAELEVTYLRSNNFVSEIATAGVPYGAGFEEYSATVGVKRKFSDRLLGTVKAGYIRSESETTGGNIDFDGPVAYVALDYGL